MMTADAGYTEEETLEFVAQLKEIGLVNFLRQYLEPLDDGSRRSLRKLMLAIGAVPVSFVLLPSASRTLPVHT